MKKNDFNEMNKGPANSGCRPAQFIYLGDPQCSMISGKANDYSQWEKLLRMALEELKACETARRENILVLMGGDLVNRVDNLDEWQAFFESCDRIKRDYNLTFVSAAGNFSRLGGYEKNEGYRERFYLPGNGPCRLEDSFYSFDRGCAHFIVLDSNYLYYPDEEAYKYIGAWIKHDLAVNSRPAVFALMHHPIYTVGSSFDDDVRATIIKRNYIKLLYRYGVDFILCGHQHLYSRTNESALITQLMGVSGTKYQNAVDRSKMQCVIEGSSLATIFTVNEKTAELKTIDATGKSVDRYSQALRPKRSGEKCRDCSNFPTCRGTGKSELLDAEKKVDLQGSPLRRKRQDGIKVNGYQFSSEELEAMERQETEYSVFRKNRLKHEKRRGIILSKLLESHDADGNVLMFISADGNIKSLEKNRILNGVRFTSKDGKYSKDEKVPAILSDEYDEDGYRLIFGQTEAVEYNGRGWIRNVAEIRTTIY